MDVLAFQVSARVCLDAVPSSLVFFSSVIFTFSFIFSPLFGVFVLFGRFFFSEKRFTDNRQRGR